MEKMPPMVSFKGTEEGRKAGASEESIVFGDTNLT